MTATAERLYDDGLEAVQLLGAAFQSLTGLVVPWNTPTDIGLATEEFQRGAFTASLVEWSDIPLLLWHDNRSWPIGVATDWDDRHDGLHARFRLAMTSVAQSAGMYARDGLLSGLSVGFSPVKSTWRYVPDGQWNPDAGVLDHVTRHQARLHEVSMTPTPAYAAARVYHVETEAVA
jgi:HK97 family phage prohead protease